MHTVQLSFLSVFSSKKIYLWKKLSYLAFNCLLSFKRKNLCYLFSSVFHILKEKSHLIFFIYVFDLLKEKTYLLLSCPQMIWTVRNFLAKKSELFEIVFEKKFNCPLCLSYLIWSVRNWAKNCLFQKLLVFLNLCPRRKKTQLLVTS